MTGESAFTDPVSLSTAVQRKLFGRKLMNMARRAARLGSTAIDTSEFDDSAYVGVGEVHVEPEIFDAILADEMGCVQVERIRQPGSVDVYFWAKRMGEAGGDVSVRVVCHEYPDADRSLEARFTVQVVENAIRSLTYYDGELKYSDGMMHLVGSGELVPFNGVARAAVDSLNSVRKVHEKLFRYHSSVQDSGTAVVDTEPELPT